MADSVKNLQVIFTGDTASLSKSFAEVQAQAEATTAKVASTEASLGKFSSSARSLGTTMSTSLTVPIVGVGVAAIKLATDFQQSMEMIHTQAGASQAEVNKLSEQVLNLAKADSYFSAEQLAGGLYHLESLGLRGAKAMEALTVASNMAAVGNADLEATASALGAAMVSGIEGTQNLNEAAGLLDATIGQGNMRMEDLVNALGSGILPVAKNAGLTLKDVGAALATLTDNGMGAEESATRLRMTFALMEAPSQKAADQLAAIGMTSTQMALDMRTKGLIPALADLRQHLIDTYGTTEEGQTKMAAALTEIFGGGRSSAAAQTLINELDRMQTKFNQIGAQSGEFSDRVAASQTIMAFQFHAAWDKIKADLTQFGEQYGPAAADVFGKLARAVTDLTNWLDHLTKGQKEVVLWVGLTVAAIGPLLVIMGTLANAIKNIIELSAIMASGISSAAGVATRAMSSMIGFVGGPVAAGAFFALAGAAVAAGLIIENAANKARMAWQSASDAATSAGNAEDDAIRKIKASNLSPSQKAARIRGISGYATGTNYAPGGLAWVGEEGPELINLPRGSQVIPSTKSAEISNNSSNNVHLTVNVGVVAGNNVQDLAATIYRELQRLSRANGFNGALPNIGIAGTG